MYEDDEIERWRHGDSRSRYPRESAVALHSTPSLSASTMSATSFRSRKSLYSSCSRHSWKSRCTRTGEFCAAGHELIQIPVLDRQRYLQRQEMLLQQEEDQQLHQQRYRHPHDIPSTVTPRTTTGPAAAAASIVIECDCCSRIISKEHYIAGCCLECDIDVCGDCFKNGQSYIDVVLEESRQNDMYDERHQEQQQQNYHHRERYDGRRPTYRGTGRCSYDDYPDPTVFQWSFTGSNTGSNYDENNTLPPVEYFEKDFGKEVGVIQLDFYYTIGTVQTTIVDAIRGTICELFTKSIHKMSPQSYRKILKDPRSYNNERYKKGAKQVL